MILEDYEMKKLAIFDFDGTLFNSVDDVVICFNKTLEKFDFPTLTKEEYFECLGGNIDEITSLVLGKNSTPENVEKVKTYYLDLYNPSKKENTLPFDGSHELLKQLQDKGVLLAVNSNRLTYSLKYFVEKFFGDIDFVLKVMMRKILQSLTHMALTGLLKKQGLVLMRQFILETQKPILKLLKMRELTALL